MFFDDSQRAESHGKIIRVQYTTFWPSPQGKGPHAIYNGGHLDYRSPSDIEKQRDKKEALNQVSVFCQLEETSDISCAFPATSCTESTSMPLSAAN